MNQQKKQFLLDRGIKPIAQDDYFENNKDLRAALNDYEIARVFGRNGISALLYSNRKN